MSAPAPLRPGDRVVLLSPAKALPEAAVVDHATAILEGWGLRVSYGEHVLGRHHQYAGTDAERLHDLQTACDDPDVAAILCARGGYGTTRIVDALDLNGFARRPKWIIGFSDITVLLAKLNRAGFQALHATMPVSFRQEGASEALESLRRVLFGEAVAYHLPPHPLNRLGEAAGPLAGGTLSIVCCSLGTLTELELRDKILFLEEVGESLYRIDRLVGQLKRAGQLAELAGLVVGQFTDIEPDAVPFGQSYEEIIAEAVAEYTYPLAFGFPVGHVGRNLALPCGKLARFAVRPDSVSLELVPEKSA